MDEKNGTIVFKNAVQAVLWKNEICGQLSDGNWENSRPSNHWMAWCRADVVVNKAGPHGRDFCVKRDRYALGNNKLLEIIGRRMLSYARLCLAFGSEEVNKLEELLDLNGEFRGLPTYGGEFWDKKRESLVDVDQQAVKKVVDDDNLFSMRDLKRELNEMKKIMKTVISKGKQ